MDSLEQQLSSLKEERDALQATLQVINRDRVSARASHCPPPFPHLYRCLQAGHGEMVDSFEQQLERLNAERDKLQAAPRNVNPNPDPNPNPNPNPIGAGHAAGCTL